MSVTPKLLRVFRIDQQIHGLQSRLRAAERFLEAQLTQAAGLNTQLESLRSQLRQLSVSSTTSEKDGSDLDSRMEQVRERMNGAQTNKEYQALLVEMNTLKADKSKLDETALDALTQADKINEEISALETEAAERDGVLNVARQQREERESEIKDRLDELRGQRENLVKDVPADTLARYADRVDKFGDDQESVMAPIHAHDFKRQEFVCSSCMMGIPFESVMQLLRERETTCSACGVFLYLEEDLAEKLVAKAGR